MGKRAPKWVGRLVVVCAVLTWTCAAAAASAQSVDKSVNSGGSAKVAAPAENEEINRIGWFGLSREVRVEGKFGQATRLFRGYAPIDGMHGYAQVEAAKFMKASRLGNLAGIEVVMGLGYTQAAADIGPSGGSNTADGVRDMTPFMFDLGIGFPVTLFHMGGPTGERLMIGIAPGMGINFQHGYLQIKAKAALRLTQDVAAEAQWSWVPGTVSLPNGDRPINTATVKGSLYWGEPGQSAWLVFAEYTRGQWEREVPGATNAAYFGGENPFTATKRGAFETSFSFGAGKAF